MKQILLPLLLIAAPLPAAAQAYAEFLVVRCNAKTGGSSFTTSLEVHFPGRDEIVHVVGEEGLTDEIAYDGPQAVAWVRSLYPEQTAGAEAYYDNACGYEQGQDDD